MSRKRPEPKVIVSHGYRVSKYKLGSNAVIKSGMFKHVKDSKYIGIQMNLIDVLEEERLKANKRLSVGDVMPCNLGNVGIMRSSNAIITSWSYIEGDEVVVNEQKFEIE